MPNIASMFQIGGRTTALLAMLVTLLAPATAEAASSFATRLVQAGPELLRGKLAWGEKTGDGSLAIAWRSREGQIHRTKLAGKPEGRRVTHSFRDLAASSRRVTFIRRVTGPSGFRPSSIRTSTPLPPPPLPMDHVDVLLTGRPGGPYERLSRARGSNYSGGKCDSGSQELTEVDAARRAIGLLETVVSCEGRNQRVRDRVVVFRRQGGRMASEVLAKTPLRYTWDEGPMISDLRMAGHYVAWVRESNGGERQSACVYDRRADAIVYCLKAPRPWLEDILEWVALQRDGKLVVGSGAFHEVVWASRLQPRPHRIGFTFVNEFGPASIEVAFVRNLIAFHRQGTESQPNDLAVADLHGNAVSVFTPEKGQALRELDLDGRRLAWSISKRNRQRVTLHMSRVRAPSGP